MNKIGIVTLYDDINIGNKLQNYAVQVFFENMGFSCETIRHWEMAHPKITFNLILHKCCQIIGLPKNKAKKLRLKVQRKNLFKKFSNKYLNLGACVKISKLPKNLASKYNYFVVGSDQVWHNWTNSKKEISYFFLQFASKKQRLTIAPSFGINSIDPEFENDYKCGLNSFYSLSCREESGADLIRKITGRNATVLLDPTMLINEKEWFKIEKKPNINIPAKYILLYALGRHNSVVDNFIKTLSKKENMEVIDLLDISSENLYLTTPDEFLYYIHHADLVVTDSFHACVFSILFRKNFIVFDRNTASMGNMESRIDTLLNHFSLINRKYNIEGINRPFETDFSRVDKTLYLEREKAKNFYEETFKFLST